MHSCTYLRLGCGVCGVRGWWLIEASIMGLCYQCVWLCDGVGGAFACIQIEIEIVDSCYQITRVDTVIRAFHNWIRLPLEFYYVKYGVNAQCFCLCIRGMSGTSGITHHLPFPLFHSPS